MKRSPVCIVILNWNGRDDTLACLESVARLNGGHHRVIVVDNGSSDDSAAAIRQRHPEVELIETGCNLGFAGGNNVGIRRALDGGAEYVLLLNNDTEVAPDLLDAFLAAAGRHPNAAAFGARIYFHDEPSRIWHAGAFWNEHTARFDHVGEGEVDDGARFVREGETAFACGCAMFVPAARLRALGMLDERFFLYFEETDWCFRARAAGHPSIYAPAARLWHKVSSSTGGEGSPLMLYFVTRNRLLWARRHGTVAQRRAVRAATWRSLWVRFGAPLWPSAGTSAAGLRGWWWRASSAWRNPHNRAVWLGARDYVLKRMGDCPAVVRQLTRQASLRAQT